MNEKTIFYYFIIGYCACNFTSFLGLKALPSFSSCTRQWQEHIVHRKRMRRNLWFSSNLCGALFMCDCALVGSFFRALALVEVFCCAHVKLFWCALVRRWTLMRGVGGWCIVFDVICYWNEIYILFAIFYSVVLTFNVPILRYACF